MNKMNLFDKEKTFENKLQPIAREGISRSILNLITDSILAGQLKPGDKLPTEIDFANKLQVSRSSVREATKMLSFLGVVEVKRGGGTFIASTMPSATLDQLMLSLAFYQGASKELVETRMMIEIGAAELAIDNATDDQIKELEMANLKLKEYVEKGGGSLSEQKDLDLNIHFTLLRITNNTFVEKIGKTIYRLFFASIEKTTFIDKGDLFKNHQLYIEAIKKRDKNLVRMRIYEGLSFWCKYVKDKQKFENTINGGKNDSN